MQGGGKILQYSCFIWLLLPQNYFSCKKNQKNRLIPCQIEFSPRLHIVLKMGTVDFLQLSHLNQRVRESI